MLPMVYLARLSPRLGHNVVRVFERREPFSLCCFIQHSSSHSWLGLTQIVQKINSFIPSSDVKREMLHNKQSTTTLNWPERNEAWRHKVIFNLNRQSHDDISIHCLGPYYPARAFAVRQLAKDDITLKRGKCRQQPAPDWTGFSFEREWIWTCSQSSVS